MPFREPYRDHADDPRVPGARRAQLAVELDEIRAVIRRRTDEAREARSIVVHVEDRLARALNRPRARGLAGLFIGGLRRVDRDDVQREAQDLEGARLTRAIAEEALAIAQHREATLAKRIESLSPSPVVWDRELEALVARAAMADALAFAREVLAALEDAAKLVIAAHREEIAQALTGHASADPILPGADRAVAIVRCRVDLLRACLRSLRGAGFDHAIGVEAARAKLDGAGAGPSQEWKDAVQAATAALRSVVDAMLLERRFHHDVAGL
jgi:hypothetical protein